MHLLAGTSDGVYRGTDDGDDWERVVDSGRVMRVEAFGPRVYAATRSGLHRSTDGGASWARVETPLEEVYSVLEHPVGERLFAGTHPAHLYVSTDLGETWTECEGLQTLPSRDDWHTPRHRDEAHVRSLGAAGPGRLVAGVEVGGVHLGEDDGATWSERREGVHDDVHHVLVRDDDHWVASTGGGLFRTRDAGRTWTRLDADLGTHYFREAFAHDGRLYAAASAGPPPSWDGPSGTDAALYESTDDGDGFQRVDYPGAPGPFVLSWTAAPGADATEDGGPDGSGVAGVAGSGAVYAGTTAGTVLRRDDGWRAVGSVPSSVGALLAVA